VQKIYMHIYSVIVNWVVGNGKGHYLWMARRLSKQSQPRARSMQKITVANNYVWRTV